MSGYFDTDWKKMAAMTATSDSDIEKAFADQAAGFVENKLPDLMKGDYQIGFEVVKKNDENTRMVGIFAFKVDNSLLFAPVFFLNGEIKGPLLYRTDTKTFVPATKEWSAYLVSSLERAEGQMSPKSDRRKYPPLIQMNQINMAPGTQKKASCDTSAFEVNVREHKGVPRTIPDGTCVVKLDINHPTERAKWNDRLPDGKSVLTITTPGDGCLHCRCKEAEFLFTKKDAEFFKEATSFDQSVAISDETGDTWYEMGPLQANLLRHRFFENIEKEAAMDWDQIMDTMEWPVKSAGLIKDFLLEPDYGKPAAEAIIKAASDNYEFAEMLTSIYGSPENFIPESFNVTEKSASVDTVGEVGIVNDISIFTKAAAATGEQVDIPGDFYKDGFFMYDTRMPDSKSVIYRHDPSTVQMVETPGLYSIVKDNGEWEDNVLVLSYNKDNPFKNTDGFHEIWDQDKKTPYKVAIKGNKVAKVEKLLGIRTGDVADADGLLTTIGTDIPYLIVLDGKAYGPFYGYDRSEADGITYIKLDKESLCGSIYKSKNSPYHARSVTINPNIAKSDLHENLIGNDAKFIRLGVSKEETDKYDSEMKKIELSKLEGLAEGDGALTNFIFDKWKLPKVAVTRTLKDGVKATYQMEALGEKSASMNKRSMMVKLAVDLRINANDAYDIIDEADRTGRCEFILEPHEKIASRLHLIDTPQFQDDFDPEQGVTLSPVQTFRIGIHGDQNFEPASSIGDMVNPTSLTGLPDTTVIGTAPEELRALADTYKLPNVFEHGVVGTLANTFNAIALVDKYVAKVEDGVDALGRIKFLIHWCPNDFIRAYGSDDMANMEAQVDANFIALGGLLLDLLKKTERQRRGEDPTQSGDEKSK